MALNNYLKEQMAGLSAKVFRTFNASYTLDKEFAEEPVNQNDSLPEKIVYFNAANTKVALLCNHQRSVGKGHQKQMTQFQDRLDYLNKVLQRLDQAKETIQKDKKHGFEKARAQWDKDDHEAQLEWLEKYGTEEEKNDYQVQSPHFLPILVGNEH